MTSALSPERMRSTASGWGCSTGREVDARRPPSAAVAQWRRCVPVRRGRRQSSAAAMALPCASGLRPPPDRTAWGQLSWRRTTRRCSISIDTSVGRPFRPVRRRGILSSRTSARSASKGLTAGRRRQVHRAAAESSSAVRRGRLRKRHAHVGSSAHWPLALSVVRRRRVT